MVHVQPHDSKLMRRIIHSLGCGYHGIVKPVDTMHREAIYSLILAPNTSSTSIRGGSDKRSGALSISALAMGPFR